MQNDMGSADNRYSPILKARRQIMEIKNNYHGPEYICKRYRMYDWLTKRGWKPTRTITDVHNSDYINWVYKTSEKFNSDVELYFEQLKSREK